MVDPSERPLAPENQNGNVVAISCKQTRGRDIGPGVWVLWVCTKVFKDDLDDLDLSVSSDLAVSFDIDIVIPLGVSWSAMEGVVNGPYSTPNQQQVMRKSASLLPKIPLFYIGSSNILNKSPNPDTTSRADPVSQRREHLRSSSVPQEEPYIIPEE